MHCFGPALKDPNSEVIKRQRLTKEAKDSRNIKFPSRRHGTSSKLTFPQPNVMARGIIYSTIIVK